MKDIKNPSLTEAQIKVLRDKGTEPPFTGEYLNTKADGMYHCANCGQALFSSNTKFESQSGWPSFWQAVSDQAVQLQTDTSFGMTRTEVTCANCGGHLGHVFGDPQEDKTGQYYCINSLALNFKEEETSRSGN